MVKITVIIASRRKEQCLCINLGYLKLSFMKSTCQMSLPAAKLIYVSNLFGFTLSGFVLIFILIMESEKDIKITGLRLG